MRLSDGLPVAAPHEHQWGTIEGGLIYCDSPGCDGSRPITDREAFEFIWGSVGPSGSGC